MPRNQQLVSAGGRFVLLLVLLNAVVLERGFVAGLWWYKLLYFTIPLLLLSILRFRKNLF